MFESSVLANQQSSGETLCTYCAAFKWDSIAPCMVTVVPSLHSYGNGVKNPDIFSNLLCLSPQSSRTSSLMLPPCRSFVLHSSGIRSHLAWSLLCQVCIVMVMGSKIQTFFPNFWV